MYRLDIVIHGYCYLKSYGSYNSIEEAQQGAEELCKKGFWLNLSTFYPPRFIKRVDITNVEVEIEERLLALAKKEASMKEEREKDKPWWKI